MKRYQVSVWMLFFGFFAVSLILAPLNASAVQTVTVEGNIVNIRSGPDDEIYEKVGRVKEGDVLEYVDTEDDWYKVKFNGGTGWITGEYVSETEEGNSDNDSGAIPIFVNKSKIETDAEPYIDSNNRTMVPLRFIAESLGAEVDWNGGENTASVKQSGYDIKLTVGEKEAYVNNEKIEIDTVPVIKNSRTMIPLRFVSERLGCDVSWNEDEKSVYIAREPQKEDNGSSEDTMAKKGLVTGTVVYIRSGPSRDYSDIDKVREGTELIVKDSKDGWYKIETSSGTEGWIAGWLVALEENDTADNNLLENTSEGVINQKAIVITGTARIRKGPSIETDKIGEAYRGQELNLLERDGNWLKISGRNIREGWIADWLVALKEEPYNNSGNIDLASRNDDFSRNRISNFEYESTEDKLELTIEGQEKIKFDSREMSDPDRIVIDILGGELKDSDKDKEISVSTGPVKQISVGQLDRSMARFVFDVRSPGAVSFEEQGKSLTISINHAPLKEKTVVLDPGHGLMQSESWSDPGAISPSGLKERDLVTDMVKTAGEILSSKGATVIYTRTGDTVLSLKERAELANSYSADVFVSVHCNASPSPKTEGTSTYYYIPSEMSGRAKTDREDLASLLQEEMLHYLGRKNLGLFQERFSVLRNTSIPSALVEIAFLTNEEEEKLLVKQDFREEAGTAVASGIIRYLER